MTFRSTVQIVSAALAVAAAPVSRSADPYGDAVARVEARQAADDSVVAPGGRSILLAHGHRTARFVLLHGFTDAPSQFAALGERFFAGGDNVYIPRLPHHAERAAGVGALARVRAGELAAFGDSAVEIARGLGDSVIVVGLSAGGTIGGSIVARDADVKRVVLVAPALAPGRLSEDAAHGLVVIATRLPNISRTSKPDTTRPEFGQGVSTRGLAELLRLGETVRLEAGRTPPSVRDVVMLLNENDQTVNGPVAVDVSRNWSDRGALVLVYQFPQTLRLPHNVMEVNARGGKLDVVLPVIEALAKGAPAPQSVRYRAIH